MHVQFLILLKFSGLAWIVIPQQISGSVPGSNISWRIFTGLCGVPALLAGIFLFFFPESPKFLLAKNQERKALQILKNVYNMNNRKTYLRRPYPVRFLLNAQFTYYDSF
jgi:VNT family MFS transporter (synaptic vesicle glycoprotein 2)